MEIHPNVTRIKVWWEKAKDEVNVYFIKGDLKVIIDTGPPDVGHADINTALKALGLTLADIDLILNTHGHQDHTGDNVPVQAAADAEIYIHRDEALYLEDPARCFDRQYAPVMEKVRGHEFIEEGKAAFLKNYKEAKIGRTLDDNDLIQLGAGIELQVIHLPGHTPGSVGFYWEKEGILFSGDSVVGLHTENGRLPIISDLSGYRKSLKRLTVMPIQTLLCGHRYRALTLPADPLRQGDAVGKFLKDSQVAADTLDEALERVTPGAGDKPLLEITDDVISGMPEEMGFQLKTRAGSATTVFWCLRQRGGI